jgi:Flp pilus assembly pilin Flp
LLKELSLLITKDIIWRVNCPWAVRLQPGWKNQNRGVTQEMNDMLLKLWIKAQILREDHGQDMVEYALVVGIIALGATLTMGTVATNVGLMFTAVAKKISTQTALIT